MNTMAHAWRFHRIGGLDQVALESDADLRALSGLDQKLWVALSCPVAGLEIPESTLKLLDVDGDGRIRVPEVLAAVAWAGSRLKDLGEVVKGSDVLPVESIDDSTDDGRATLASVRRILTSLGTPDADVLTLAQAADTVGLFSRTTLNGDGVIIAASTEDEALRTLIGEIGATVGTVTDRSGVEGIDATRIENFYAAVDAHAEWLRARPATTCARSGMRHPPQPPRLLPFARRSRTGSRARALPHTIRERPPHSTAPKPGTSSSPHATSGSRRRRSRRCRSPP